MGLTISVSAGAVALDHNRRKYTPPNADPEMSKLNFYLKRCDNLEKTFNEIFSTSASEYNAKQKRKDRHIKNYYKEINDSNRKEKPCYEFVFQLGSVETNPVSVDKDGRPYWYAEKDDAGNVQYHRLEDDLPENERRRFSGPNCKVSVEILREYADSFQKNNPNFKVVSSCLHLDEATPHLHISFIPVATGYKQKMKTRCSLTGALKSMGYDNSSRQQLASTQWIKDQNDKLEQLMKDKGIERDFGDGRKKHYSPGVFKETILSQKGQQMMADAKKEAQKIMDDAKKNADLSVESAKSEVQVLKDEKIALEQNLSLLEGEKTDYLHQLSEIKRKIEGEQLELDKLGRRLENAWNDYRTIPAEVAQLRKVVDALHPGVAEAEDLSRKLKEAEKTIKNLESNQYKFSTEGYGPEQSPSKFINKTRNFEK